MYRIPVSSSNIRSIGYESGILEVEFSSGHVYQYFDVPPQVHKAFLNSTAYGEFLNENIRYFYRYQKIS